jgi:hypothetical protein
VLPSLRGIRNKFPSTRGVACEAMTGCFLSPTPPYRLPLAEGNKRWIPLYRGVTNSDLSGGVLYSHPALRAPLAEGKKKWIPLYKRGGKFRFVGVKVIHVSNYISIT